MNLKNLAMWVVIVFLTIGLYNMFKNPQNSINKNDTIIFSKFLSEVDEGRVVEVQIQGNNIYGVLSNGRKFSTYSPNDPNLIEKLTDRGVSISAAPINEKMPSLFGVLLSWFPMLLLIAVWIFFMRQMQGGKGGAMGFGRSKAKMMNELKGKVTFNDVAGIEEAKEAVGSMGDDTPIAVLSDKYRPLSHFFRQNFSQVTNPPIDSLRENEVMSLKTRFGNLGNILDFENLTKDNIHVMESPILSNSQFKKFTVFFKDNLKVLDCTFDVQGNLKKRLDQLCSESEIAVREGCKHLILSDKKISEKKAAIPMVLVFGAINSKLVNLGIRGFVSINVQTGEVLDTHSFAVLLGVGATTINPYLISDSIYQRYEKKLFGKLSYEKCIQRYI